MTNAEARRQKQLARKRQKRKAKANQSIADETWSIAKRITVAATAPIHECLAPADLFEQGIGILIFSRALPKGRIAAGLFMLDVFCLGVKNAVYAILPEKEYMRRLSTFPGAGKVRRVDPAYLRKLVEGAVAYAHDLGFNPHFDYAETSQIFGDVDATLCLEQFVYGQEGKPHYISGPNETPIEMRAIIEQLDRRLGPEKFHFTVALDE